MRKLLLLGLLLIPPTALGVLTRSEAQPATGDAKQPKLRDARSLPEVAQPIFSSGLRALEWLKLTNKPDGRFVYGFQPALRVQLDGDNFLSQAGALFALARASRYYRDAHGAARASQGLLTLKLQTTLDPTDKSIRYTAAPPEGLNRLSANGMLVLAVHELPDLEKHADQVKFADELCNYLRLQQKDDGSLFVAVGNVMIKSSDEADAEHAGWALHGIIRSQKHRPADWKLEMLRKARTYYHTYWQGSKHLSTVCSHTAAFAEAYVQTKEQAFADTVFAMNDWLAGLQYREAFDSSRRHWTGGFPRQAARAETAAPDISSAAAAESLAEACRVAKLAGDLPRAQRYERALLTCFNFLLRLQYSSQNTDHFVDSFRPMVLGAFHVSHQDGNIRIDATQHTLCAMVQYLEGVAE